MTNTDGSRRTDSQMNTEEDSMDQTKGGKKKKSVVQGAKSNASKIQFLLDQRKPPTEKLPSLCAEYDDDLFRIAGEMDLM